LIEFVAFAIGFFYVCNRLIGFVAHHGGGPVTFVSVDLTRRSKSTFDNSNQPSNDSNQPSRTQNQPSTSP
jgi:hypothetical protein